ncbi:hypothetical protein ACFL6C_02555 [Myxococcota bacterium]
MTSRCIEVLRENDCGGHTLPARDLYPHQWAWDSAFAAIGWAHIDPSRAVIELRSLFAGQWEDGRVPHIQFNAEAADYWPDQEVWRAGKTSSLTQPPLWATAIRRLLDLGVRGRDLAALLPAVERSHLFFHNARDPERLGLVAIVHPWESGLDNSPAWDDPLAQVAPSNTPLRRRDIAHVDAEQRPTDEHYRRYLALVEAIAANDFGAGPFAVYDPMMTALLARAESDLAFVAERVGFATTAAERAERLTTALTERLWDSELGRFRYRDAVAARDLTPNVIGAYMPVILALEQPILRRLQHELETQLSTPWPIPSTAPSDSTFDPRCYWRGPSWINLNWLLVPRLGSTLRERTLDLVDRSGFREYYHPLTGEGLGARRFTWTAALVLDLLAGG